MSILENRRENLKLIVVLVLESKALYWELPTNWVNHKNNGSKHCKRVWITRSIQKKASKKKLEESWKGLQLWFLKTYWPNSFPKLLFCLFVTLYRALETYLFDIKRWFCHSQVIAHHTRESKTVLDSGFHAADFGFQLLDSSFCQWSLDSGFQSLEGSATREAGFAQILARDRDDRCAGCGIVLKKERECEISFPPLACRQALRGSLAAWREKEGELANLNSNSNFPVAPRRLSCQIAANQREARTSANVNKHWKTSAKGNDVITNVISAN